MKQENTECVLYGHVQGTYCRIFQVSNLQNAIVEKTNQITHLTQEMSSLQHRGRYAVDTEI